MKKHITLLCFGIFLIYINSIHTSFALEQGLINQHDVHLLHQKLQELRQSLREMDELLQAGMAQDDVENIKHAMRLKIESMNQDIDNIQKL